MTRKSSMYRKKRTEYKIRTADTPGLAKHN